MAQTRSNLYEISVNGSPQYKVKNSKSSVFYITASSTYVEVS